MNNFEVTVAQNGHEAYEIVMESLKIDNQSPTLNQN